MKYNETDNYQYMTILGKEGVFTPERIDAGTLPEGFQKHELHFNENSGFDAICSDAKDRCGGTFVTKEELKLPKNGHLALTEDDFAFQQEKEFDFETYFGKKLDFDYQVAKAQAKHDAQVAGMGKNRDRDKDRSDKEK